MSNNKQDQNIGSKTQQSLVWFTVVPTLLHVIRFVNSIILARILSPADFGIVGIATILLYLSNSITNFGFSKAIVQRKNICSGHYNVYFTFNLVMSVFFYGVFNFYSHEIAVYFREPDLEPVIEAIALLFLISALLAVPMTAYRRDINFKILAIAEALKVFVSMGVSLTLALNGYGFWSIIFAMIVSHLIAMMLVRISSSIEPKLLFRYSYFKDLFKFGVWDLLWGQSKMLGDNIDKILIGRMLDVTQLGLFEKAGGLAKMPYEQFSQRLGMVSFSTFSRVQNDEGAVKNYLSKMMILNAFICFPLYVGLFAVAENFTLVLLGEKWLDVINPLKVLSISFLVASIMAPLISVNVAMGHIKQQTLLRVAGLVLLILFLVWCVPLGILVVSYVALGFNIYLFITSFYLLKIYSGITVKRLLWDLYPAAFGALILFISVSLSTNFLFNESRSLSLLAGIVVGVFSYSLCVLFIPFKQWGFIRKRTFDRLKENKFFSARRNK